MQFLSNIKNVALAFFTFAAFTLIARPCAAQNVFWVDMTNGSNFGNGSATTPWRTVDFALNGVHAPLPQGSTIRIVGQDPGISYSPTSGEAFPWVLYNNISLIADEPPGKSVVVDTTGSTAIEFNQFSQTTSARIEGISFQCINGPIARIEPATGVAHAPTFESCEFTAQSGIGVQISGGSLGIVAPVLRNCSVTSGTNAVRLQYQTASYAGTIIDGCALDGNSATIHVDGAASQGLTEIIDNDVVSSSNNTAGILIDADALISIVDNRIVQNAAQSGNGVELRDNSLWQQSVIRNNDIDGFLAGYYFLRADNVTVSGGNLTGNTYGTYFVAGTDDITVRSCTVAFGSYGVGLNTGHSGSSLRIEGCSFEDLQNDGIVTTFNVFPGTQVLGCTFLRSQSGLNLAGVSDWIVQGNRIEDMTNAGIRLTGSTPCSFIGNELLRCQDGVRVADATGLILSSNIIAESLDIGVDLQGPLNPSPAPLLENNTIVNSVNLGLQTSLASTVEPYVGNSIFWGNNGIGSEFVGLGFGQYFYCTMEHGGSPGNGNSDVNPDLTATYRLKASSWCREAGDFAWASSSVDVDGDPRLLDDDWDGTPRPNIGADELSDTTLALVGPYGLGDNVTANVKTLPNASVNLYLAADSREAPIVLSQGVVSPSYGNFLLEVSKLQGNIPFTAGIADLNGDLSLPITVPSLSSIVGWHVAVQVLATDSQINAGQLSAARSFEITE